MKRLLISMTALAAMASTALASSLVRPNDMGTGALLFESKQPGQFIQAPRLDTDFEVTVTGQIARTRVTQRFENPAQAFVEGVYVFPLPENAAVDTLKMVIGERVIVGDIKEKQEAKAIYEQAKASGQKAALLEQERPNIFTNSIANIGPGESVVVQIEYQQPVRQTSGEFSLRVPMVVGPRYNPAPGLVQAVSGPTEAEMFVVNDPVPDRARIEPPVLDPRTNSPVNPITVTVNLEPGFNLGQVKSSYHEVQQAGDADSRKVQLSYPAFADRDFELLWTAQDQKQPTVSVFAESVNANDYAMVQVTPPAVEAAQKPLPREAIFVIDNSGSMSGDSMPQAKASLIYALDRLQPGDRFNVIRFDNTMDLVFPNVVEATRENIDFARTFVSRLDANGGTEMLAPLAAALNDQTPDDNGFLRQIIFLTDGSIGNEQQMFDMIGKGRGRSRVFMVGIGSAPNSFLMTRMAELGRGTFTQIGQGNQVEERMRDLFAKLENPVVTGLNAQASATGVELTPNTLPDLYKGEPLTMLIKTTKLEGTITVSGYVAGQAWTQTVALDKPTSGSGIAKLWARRGIEDAEVSQSLRGVPSMLADARILQLATEHHLVSRMTSLVAVDKTPSRPAGQRLTRADIPLNLPAGWDFDKVFGGEKPAIERKASLDNVQLASLKTSLAPVTTAHSARQMILPQTATRAELFTLFGFGFLISAAFLYFRARRLA